MTLYEIDKAIAECVDEETGEIIDIDRLNALQIDRATKIENVAMWVKDLFNLVQGIEDEEARLKERRERTEKQIERLKDWLASACQVQKFETPKARVTFRKSERVIIDDDKKIPKEYTVTVETTRPDRVKIKEAIKNGCEVDGAKVEIKYNAQIQ